MQSWTRSLMLGGLAAVLGCAASARAEQVPIDNAITAGRSLENGLAPAIDELKKECEQRPQDDNLRLALGTAQALRAVEKLAGSLHEYGVKQTNASEGTPFLRIPVEANPDPKPITNAAMDAMFKTFNDDMNVAIETLKQVDDPNVKVTLRPGMIQIDLNGDAPGGLMPAYDVIAAVGRTIQKKEAEDFTIDFDLGDARWLEGYCHLLCAMSDLVQGYDKTELIARTGHMFFSKVDSPYGYLQGGKKVYSFDKETDVADIIAFIHLINLPVKDADKIREARQHLLAVIQLSRESWKAIRAESDNSHEWIPNENQDSVLGRKLTAETIDSWLKFLDDAETVLKGEKLLPFWRGEDGTGVNLMKAFDEPATFDLVLWVQGTAALPYLEKDKPIVTGDNIHRLEQLIQGDFYTFALWVN